MDFDFSDLEDVVEKVLVLDLETTVQYLGTKTDNSPFNPDNRCVSAHFAMMDEKGGLEDVTNLVFHHVEKAVPDSPAALTAALAAADVMVAHNAKFDCLWLTQMGFTLPKRIYCTMIGEYILAKGQSTVLKLSAIAEAREVSLKKSDLIDHMFKVEKKGFEVMPLDTVLEYAEADVVSCGEIYQSQLEDYAKESNQGLWPTVILMNEMLIFLLDMETNGIKVDMDALHKVETEFAAEKLQLTRRLSEIIEEVMGDTPINLNSGADMSAVIYSRRVVDRDIHKQTFNIGVDYTGRKLYPPRMTPAQFTQAVKLTTFVVNRTTAEHCTTCNGRGSIQKIKKDGTPWKIRTKCVVCVGIGAVYRDNGKIAGLKLTPRTVGDASINGFKTDKDTISSLVSQATAKGNLLAVEFLTKSSRLNAVTTYLDSFVKGIQTWTRPDGLLHSNFNQCITATGRLSSSNPNFQNQPKRGFPIRRAVVSRFVGGKIVEADYAGLEFRVAGELSRDPQIIEDILNGKDTHKQTASIIHQCSMDEISKDQRQRAKEYTFAPLYGGKGSGEPPHIRKYFEEFFEIYSGLKSYQGELMDGVVRTGTVTVPSGRQYYWKNAKRLRSGRVSNATQVVNYPVQGFATADIVPLACIRALRMFREHNVLSKMILTVHDSIVIDLHPTEHELVLRLIQDSMVNVTDELLTRFNYTTVVPLDIEASIGDNWLDQDEIELPSAS
jgi:DNA polymerase I-like protein with 3'-5' exonuclease and polymerase domains